MLIAIIPVTDYLSAKQQLFQLSDRADGIELRLDYAPHWDIQELTALRQACTLPVIFTLRNQMHGGFYPYSEAQRLQTLSALCALNPDYLDLEFDVSEMYIQSIRNSHPAIKIILSYHNFAETPADLPRLFQSIYQPNCYAYKISTQAQTTSDALRMLHLVFALRNQHRVIGICMGEKGQCTRILAPVVGSLFSYAYSDHAQTTAPGQLSLDELTTRYHYRELSPATKVYALLGDPVHLSVGHILHNQAMAMLEKNAVYVKLHITQLELPFALTALKQLPFWGFSITMPLKEVILPLLDEMDSDACAIKAVNTVVRKQQQWLGLNTDGLGAIRALSGQKALNLQTIVLFGAGGAARAIAYTARSLGAKVIILNRTLATAKKLADEFDCEAYELEAFTAMTSYSLCVNTLPEKAFEDSAIQAVWHPNYILPGTVAMDIVYQPIETAFLRIAAAAGCRCIPGFQMYIAQALLQIQHWFQPPDEMIIQIQTLMEKFFISKN